MRKVSSHKNVIDFKSIVKIFVINTFRLFLKKDYHFATRAIIKCVCTSNFLSFFFCLFVMFFLISRIVGTGISKQKPKQFHALHPGGVRVGNRALRSHRRWGKMERRKSHVRIWFIFVKHYTTLSCEIFTPQKQTKKTKRQSYFVLFIKNNK